MAYRDVYREYGQLSTGGASPLDGVPIAIAEKYRPPPRVLLSSAAFEPRHVCDVLEDEYDFDLEASVLERYAAQVEAEAAEERAKVDQIGSAIEDFSRAYAMESLANLEESDEVDVPVALPHGIASEPSQGVSYKNNASSLASQQDSMNPVVSDQAFVLPFSNTILKPTPLVPARQATPKEETKLFRVRDFETVDDPFDDLELEVLDDMAELGKVLQVAQTQQTKSPVDNTSTTSTPLVNGDSHAVPVSQAVTDNRYSPQPSAQVPVHRMSPQPQVNTACQSVSFHNSSVEPTHIQTSNVYPRQSPTFVVENESNTVSVTGRANNDVLKHGAVTNLAARTDRFSLPNINLPNVNPQPGLGTKGNPLPPIGVVNNRPNVPDRTLQNGPTFTEANNLDNFAKFSSFDRDSIPMIATQNNVNPYSRHSITATDNVIPSAKDTAPVMAQSFNASYSYGQSNSNSIKDYQSDTSCTTTRPLSGLRSARSTPDISKLCEDSKPSYPLSHSPPPKPSLQQVSVDSTWNRYSPLPPSPNPRNSLSDNSRTSTPTSSESPTGLSDPFTRLSHEEQELTLSVADMGFSRAQVARAVQKLGANGKQVVDHLCQVNRLAESGCSTEDAESSLHLFDNDIEKAKDYLELQSQFKELGFHHDKVREALVLHDNNRDKALDYLTA